MVKTKRLKSILRLAAGLAGLAVAGNAAPMLTVRPERSSAFDLEVSGLVGSAGFISADDLAGLPRTTLRIPSGLDGAGGAIQELSVVWLEDLWARLPKAAGANAVLARCKDGYFSVYEAADFQALRPFLVLEINGVKRAGWSGAGLPYDPGPNVILVSADVAPAVATLTDAGHKMPWGVTALEIVRYEDAFGAGFAGARAVSDGPLAAGRDIWINSCASCHAGPDGMPGGTKSGRPFEVLAAQARHNRAYFELYVRDPKTAMSGATMEAHPHYDTIQMEALVAFITAGAPR